MEDKAFDKSQLSHMDSSLRAMVDKSYELCLYRCGEEKGGQMSVCKQSCFKNIIVPYRHANHVARDSEENNYRKCLANSKTFPALKQEDFIRCSNGVFEDRIEVLSNHMAEEAARIFNTVRD